MCMPRFCPARPQRARLLGPDRACQDSNMAKTAIRLSNDEEADALLSKEPLALLIGMVLDQQIPLERAFWAPAELSRRLGQPLDAAEIAAADPEEFAEVFKARPALHRFPGAMAGRVQAVCGIVADEYGGKAAA